MGGIGVRIERGQKASYKEEVVTIIEVVDKNRLRIINGDFDVSTIDYDNWFKPGRVLSVQESGKVILR